MAARYCIDNPRNGAQSIIWWNLMLAPGGQPGPSYDLSAPVIVATNGALTYKPEYAGLAHLGRTLQRGAKRIGSTQYDTAVTDTPNDVQSVAWLNPDGSRVAFVFNGSGATQTISVIDQAAGSATVDKVSVNDKSMVTVRWPVLSAAINKALPPQIKAAVGVAKVTVSLANNPPANGGAVITGYNIYKTTTSGSEIVVATNVSLPYDVTGLTGGTQYFFQAAAVTSAGEGVRSAEITATPAASTGGAAPAHYVTGTSTTSGVLGQFPINANNVVPTNFVDVRVFVNLTTLTPSAYLALFGQYTQTGSTNENSSYQLVVNTTGTLSVWWFDNGANTFRASECSVALSSVIAAGQDVWLRVKLNPNATAKGGLAAATCQFLYSTDAGATWTQMGALNTVVTAGVSKASAITKAYVLGKFYKAVVQDENGAILVNPDVTIQTSNASFQDTAASPNIWAIDGAFT
jgi:hypothetical protein